MEPFQAPQRCESPHGGLQPILKGQVARCSKGIDFQAISAIVWSGTRGYPGRRHARIHRVANPNINDQSELESLEPSAMLGEVLHSKATVSIRAIRWTATLFWKVDLPSKI